ncbi:hypothetical protein L6164_017871 [Bauhinia variegata]|uniref:Uncharacterized protein n=1 Tax=Bauhinia variegata TaxID=167791 RepID=A0ACB9N9H2_BAUVA|nr:hypothetical protein L6164_017871 [Bauhinia variegata]
MFDWNDEELANIIWGEAGESDDHIVPYPEATEDLRNRKEWNQEAGNKPAEQKKPEAKNDFHGRKLGSSSNLNNSEGISVAGFGANSWPDLSLSSAVKTDQCSLGTDVSKNSSEISKFSSSRNDEGKEQGDLVDYGWANIGSFDDLDRIFSNDDPIFGHVNLDNADELWSSSKNATNDPAPLSLDTQSPAGILKNRSEPEEIKADYVQHGDPSLSLSYVKIGGSASHDVQNAHPITAELGYDGGRSKPATEQQMNQDMVGKTDSMTSGLTAENVAPASTSAAKAFGQRNLPKARKKSHGKQEEQALQDFFGNWSPSSNSSRQFENPMSPSIIQSSTSSVLRQQKQLQGADSLCQNITNPYVASRVYGNLTNTYPAMPMLSQAQPGDLRHRSLLSGYEVSTGMMNPMKKSVDSGKALTMTPQEKIEKLRRRQQMQAMFAIQKQQQQLGRQVPCTNKPMAQKSPLEIQRNSCDGADREIDDLSSLPAVGPPIEQDDSNKISVAVNDYIAEDTILYRLQDIISKLDMQIRLCFRDSLFRLAHSAMQRHHASDTSSTNKRSREELEVVAREESNSQNRYGRGHDVETETNPIDRTVAHLLFHRPLEFKLESPVSANVQFESKTSNLMNLPVGCLSAEEDLKNSQPFSPQGFKNPCSLFEPQRMDQFKNSPRIDTSDNASNNGPPDVASEELEASQ